MDINWNELEALYPDDPAEAEEAAQAAGTEICLTLEEAIAYGQ